MTVLWLNDEQGSYPVEPKLPNTWQGEPNCVVGPFSSKTVAQTFVALSCDQVLLRTERIFAKRDAWYVELKTWFV